VAVAPVGRLAANQSPRRCNGATAPKVVSAGPLAGSSPTPPSPPTPWSRLATTFSSAGTGSRAASPRRCACSARPTSRTCLDEPPDTALGGRQGRVSSCERGASGLRDTRHPNFLRASKSRSPLCGPAFPHVATDRQGAKLGVQINPSITIREALRAVVRLRRQRGELPPALRGVGVVSAQTVSRMRNARSRVGTASSRSPWSHKDEGEVLRLLAVSGWAGTQAILKNANGALAEDSGASA
jgi:hypothetical protein